MIENLNEIIRDSKIFHDGYILREGFPFTCITNPANIYDAIIIKPRGAESFSPRFPEFYHSIDDYVLFVNKHSLNKAIIISDDIEFLDKCPTLKYLCVLPSNSAGNDFDFSPLYMHKGLIYLRCYTEYGWNFNNHSSIDYSKLNELIRLDMSGQGHLNADSIKTLKTLSVGEIREKNLYKVFNSTVLDMLEITNCSIENLSGIEQAEKLLALGLYYNRRLSDISALESAKTTLRSLVIENCAQIKDFSVIQKLEKLEALTLLGNNTIPDLNFLRNSRKLKFFRFSVNVSNGDLTPCVDLQFAVCQQGRRHYNLKDKDLPKNKANIDKIFEDIDAWRHL